MNTSGCWSIRCRCFPAHILLLGRCAGREWSWRERVVSRPGIYSSWEISGFGWGYIRRHPFLSIVLPFQARLRTMSLLRAELRVEYEASSLPSWWIGNESAAVKGNPFSFRLSVMVVISARSRKGASVPPVCRSTRYMPVQRLVNKATSLNPTYWERWF